MRPIWSGVVGFGLVNIPVRLYVASEEKSLNFDYLNRKDMSPVRYARIDKATGEEVPYRDIVKGYQYRRGDYVVLDEDDFRKASVRKARMIQIVDFVQEKDVDIKLLEKPFYLEPAKEAKKTYALLRDALARSGKVAVTRFVLKTREHLGILKAEGDALVLDQMRFASEIRSPAGLDLPKDEEISAQEIELALRLVDQLSKPFHPERYKDTYTEELKSLIAEKSKGKARRVRKETEPQPTGIFDLFSRLRESLAHAEEHKK